MIHETRKRYRESFLTIAAIAAYLAELDQRASSAEPIPTATWRLDSCMIAAASQSLFQDVSCTTVPAGDLIMGLLRDDMMSDGERLTYRQNPWKSNIPSDHT